MFPKENSFEYQHRLIDRPKTIIPASQIVPVVPTFAPRMQAIAEGKGKAPLTTNPTIAVVLRELDCQRRVHRIP